MGALEILFIIIIIINNTDVITNIVKSIVHSPVGENSTVHSRLICSFALRIWNTTYPPTLKQGAFENS